MNRSVGIRASVLSLMKASGERKAASGLAGVRFRAIDQSGSARLPLEPSDAQPNEYKRVAEAH